jgi:VanZ family protein
VSSNRRSRTLKPTPRSLAHRWWPVAFWLAVIRLESTDFASAANTKGVLHRIAVAIFGTIDPTVVDAVNTILRKSGHFVGYAILSLLVFRALKYTQRDRLRLVLHRRWGIFFRDLWQWNWAVIAVLFTFITAALDEIHQASLASRTGQWQDVALDTAGAIAMQFLLYARAAHAVNLQRKHGTEIHEASPHH